MIRDGVKYDDLTTDVDRLHEALHMMMVGGNHIASQLISRLGADFCDTYPPDYDHESALRLLGATVDYDMWCCWSAIMRAREAVRVQPNPPH